MKHPKKNPKMALDFDEVITKSVEVFARTLLVKQGIVLPEHVYHFGDWQDSPLTEEEYHHALFYGITHTEWIAKVELMPGALGGIRELLACGVEIEIVTARGKYEGEVDAVRTILNQYDLDLLVVGTAYQPKVNFLNDHVVALDDQVRELIAMPSRMHRLLFSRPHNQAAWQDPGGGIIPARDWPHAVETIRTLLDI